MIKDREELTHWCNTMIHHPAHEKLKDELIAIKVLENTLHRHDRDVEQLIEKVIMEAEDAGLPAEKINQWEERMRSRDPKDLLKESFGDERGCPHDVEVLSQIQLSIDYCNDLLRKHK